MLRPSPNHGTQRLPNDDDDEEPNRLLTNNAHIHLEVECKHICTSSVGLLS